MTIERSEAKFIGERTSLYGSPKSTPSEVPQKHFEAYRGSLFSVKQLKAIRLGQQRVWQASRLSSVAQHFPGARHDAPAGNFPHVEVGVGVAVGGGIVGAIGANCGGGGINGGGCGDTSGATDSAPETQPSEVAFESICAEALEKPQRTLRPKILTLTSTITATSITIIMNSAIP